MTGSARPALRYFGGKWRLAPWIIRHLPPHECYVEPFAGGASVLLRKPAAPFEVYNDLDSEVVTFFRVLRERPGELVRAIDLTPWSREEYLLAHEPADDALERARRLFVRCHQSFGGSRGTWRQGWRTQAQHAGNRDLLSTWRTPEYLHDLAARLRHVQFEHTDAERVIERFDRPSTLFYCDPPYVPASRGERWRSQAYRHELDEGGHVALAAQLDAVHGMVAISGYPSELYDRLFAGWRRVEHKGTNNACAVTTECLWLNPAAQRQLLQPSLFEERSEALQVAAS